MLSTSSSPFGSMVTRLSRKKSIEDIQYLKKKDRRMRFNTSQDPIYYVFDCIENRPLSVLAKEFVKDSFFETVNFVTKIVG